MKRIMTGLVGIVLLISIIVIAVTAEGDKRIENDGSESQEKLVTIGFSQVGAESDWRTANSISIKQTFTPERGYDLLFEDAKQKQSNQIMAIRRFIQQEVDYIVFSPVVESGWETVLEEAKRAGIPVIVIDRKVSVRDTGLYTAWIGSNFYLEGQKACKVLNHYVEENQIPEVNIVNIQGSLGATSQIGRTNALEDAADKYGWNLLAQESGEYTEAKAYEVMTKMLKEYEDINFVYCENDNEAFGAIDAIKAAGYEVGGEEGQILVMSFDTTNAGLTQTLSGEITCDTECNPLHGPRVEEIIQKLEAGEEVEKQAYVDEVAFAADDTVTKVTVDGTDYEITPITQEIIDGRAY